MKQTKIYNILQASKLIGISQPCLRRHVLDGNINIVYRQIPAIQEAEIARIKALPVDKWGRRQLKKAKYSNS